MKYTGAINIDLIGEKVNIMTKDKNNYKGIIDEVEHGGNSDRYYPDGTGIAYLYINEYRNIIYEDEIESIEILDNDYA
ncbi:MAG: hypothetical protein IKP75_10215 [Oscillospiraceae bacterium]|nr:hypothetical protein [Oscillospiraceae bacterium]